MKPVQILFLSLILVLLSNVSNAQVKKYAEQWKKVDDLIQKKNLPKSALEEVKKIYTLAKKEKQDAQVIKALVYMSRLQNETTENAEVSSIREIEKEIASSTEPSASILRNLLANMYLQYLQQHRWQLYQRTNTIGFDKNDIATWTLEDFHKKISDLFLQSISNESILKQTKLESFEPIIIKGNVRHLRPTLYDLLTSHALSYFQNDERDIKKPAYAFEINHPQAFSAVAEFVNFRFHTRDSLSLQHKALQIYQKLLAFHLRDAKPDALIDIDINRIRFVYENSVAEQKDSLYQEALKNIIHKNPSNVYAKQASFLLAAFYNQQASTYSPHGDTSKRYARIEAYKILQAVVRDSAVKSEGWTNSYNLLKEMERVSFHFEVEKVNLPGQPFRSLVKYTNANTLHFRVVVADENLRSSMETDEEKAWSQLLNARAVRSWKQSLPATSDMQEHAVEVKIDALPVGAYFLIASANEKFDRKKSPLGRQVFHVSNISYVQQKDKFFVLHRETGQPLEGASLNLFRKEYNYQSQKYIKTRLGNYKADKNGYVKVAFNNKDRQYDYLVELLHKADYLKQDEMLNNYYYYDYTRTDRPVTPYHIFFFTDRSIYRPGQLVYFKGIVVTNSKDNKTIMPGFSTTIYLRNANNEISDSLKVTANEFGSFNGKFTLPQNVLNGAFSITDFKQESATDFSVEEYKRPKFLVEFEKPTQTFKVDDSVMVTGLAKAYAGNNIDGAKVSYHVVRKPRFIYRWFYSKSWLPPVEEMEITHGETTTDKDGKFIIRFKAIPDRKLDPKTDPVFDYQVYADVTDINGETRSGNKIITAGYKSIVLIIDIPERIAIDSFNKLMIRSQNLNGEYQRSTVDLSLFPLVSPDKRLIRERYWQEPDKFVMSKSEYVDYFPNDEYKNEKDFKSWSAGPASFTKSDSTRVNGEWSMNQNLQPGFYKIEVRTKDKDGKEVKDIKYVELFDPKAKTLSHPEYLWTKTTGNPVEPGESAKVEIGSSANNVNLINSRDKSQSEVIDFNFYKLNNEKTSIDFQAAEHDRGGFGIHFFFVKDNRFYQYNDVINVPWSNKQLDIEYATFRDKTVPGSEEKWSVKITGNKNEKAAAEMLASMYDASLDQFRPHSWYAPGIWPVYTNLLSWNSENNFSSIQSWQTYVDIQNRQYLKQYDRLFFSEGYIGDASFGWYSNVQMMAVEGRANSAVRYEMSQSARPPGAPGAAKSIRYKTGEGMDMVSADTTNVSIEESGTPENPTQPSIQPRKNFNETAFFFPDLKTDANGNIEFSFTAPEALTKWKLQTLAHTKGLAFGLNTKEMVTQKELMVQPNMPRFLRQGDRMEIVAKIVNMSGKEMTGQAQLQLFDATTNQSVDGWFINSFPNQYFTVAAGASELVKFPIQVPFTFHNALTWRIVAKSGNFSDGEEDALPVLTNKTLVTETMPMPMRGFGSKDFNFEKLLKAGNSETLQHQSLTFEYTSNPAWFAVQALPYLMEYPYDCAEQVWNRYYANAIASKIANASPRLKQVFEKWKTSDTAALLSNLQKNQELKSALLEETPWVLQAKTEAEQKKNIALLFDMVRMGNELSANLGKLQEMQSSNGGFVWFKGGPDDRYITQYIVTGIGHLKKLGVNIEGLDNIVNRAMPYLDQKIRQDYDGLVKSKADRNKQQIGYYEIQYLYMRSFFPEIAVAKNAATAVAYYKKQSQQFWVKQSKYSQGMTALALHRAGDKQTPASILKSLKETSITSEEMGMYWKENSFGYSWYWWYAPIETQSLMIEAFSEISKDTKTIDDLRTWLIKNKQTNNWRTTKATAEACYAMLLQGTEWLSNEPVVQIRYGTSTISSNDQKLEAGTGYFKHAIAGQSVKPEMGKITLDVKQAPGSNAATNQPSWGSAYWQYFEDLDKITTAATPLQLEKKLFIEKNTDRGPVLSPVTNGSELRVGDRIKVRIELRVDRDMEYVHMKDMRASALEPVNVLSGYKYQGGLGYYESTKDASTNFFFNYLRKGTYVFEYSLFVSHTGNFSNGITTIQCMYAPEFSAHSEGVRISIE